MSHLPNPIAVALAGRYAPVPPVIDESPVPVLPDAAAAVTIETPAVEPDEETPKK